MGHRTRVSLVLTAALIYFQNRGGSRVLHSDDLEKRGERAPGIKTSCQDFACVPRECCGSRVEETAREIPHVFVSL
ncbi:hypothetical protein DL96DRAFT_1617519 [Flagelloscypha sp. PMI_526]|nr:hypothetical protein DL96DRAFT_1617519 [Flagelloscypha sp. PMI_526]